MTLSDKILDEIEELAGLFLAPDEIAVLLNIDIKQFQKDIRTKQGEHYRRYFLGKTKTKKEIHRNVVKLAQKGSNAAEEMADKMLRNQSLSERNG